MCWCSVFVLDSGMGLIAVTAVLIQKCLGCSHRDESELFIVISIVDFYNFVVNSET